MLTKRRITEISSEIIRCAIEVNKFKGPGLLESVYEECFILELNDAGLKVQSQIYFPMTYKGRILKNKFKIDLLVEDTIVVELKAVEIVIPLYRYQLLTYMNLSNKVKGLLINFNTENISKDLVSMVTKEYFDLPNE